MTLPIHQPPMSKEEYYGSWPDSPFHKPDHQLYRRGDIPSKKHWKYYYFKNKSIDWWLERTTHDKNIKLIVLPEAVKHIVRNELITEGESNNLIDMVNSPDKENFVVAIMVIIKYKQLIIKLGKHGKK